MSSAAVGTHHCGSGPLSLMSCVRESSPLQDYESCDTEKSAGAKRKFWNPKKWFKRKNKASEEVVPPEATDEYRSRSHSELSITDDQIRRKSSAMPAALSVSHDSVFHSPNSGSDIELDVAQSSSSLSISQPHMESRLQTELSERLRLRRGHGDTSEDDEGLPHSPCNSPTTTDVLDKTAIKDLPTKSQSTCSDGSLLSMGSSEMDEESFSQQSRHSSKLSLQEKRSSDQDCDFELGPSSSSTPLNHSAAHHRVSVRPKRRAPHRNKTNSQLSNALPTTPEVNEDSSIRSVTPENTSKETFEHYSISTKTTLTETQIKCSSLPPGLMGPDELASKLNRSQSNADGKSHELFETLEEEDKTDKSFFARILPRRSAKKKKSKEEKPPIPTSVPQNSQTHSKTVEMSYKRVESKPIAAPRSGAASRQRVQPIDLPPSPETREFECILPKPSPEKALGTSPLQAELELRIKKRQTLNAASLSPPQSPKLKKVDSSVISKVEVVSAKAEFRTESKEEIRREVKEERKTWKEEVKRETREDIRSKLKIPGLSSLQQRVLSLNDEIDEGGGHKSLMSLPDDSLKPVKPVTKSHSFKSMKPSVLEQNNFALTEARNDNRISVTKAASLDSVKTLEQPEIFEKKEESVVQSSEVVTLKLAPEVCNSDDITISGPSHTAVVNVSSDVTNNFSSNVKTEVLTSSESTKEVTTKESVSVTKIQLKRESTQITQSTVTVPKSTVPEFFNKPLNKVESKPTNSIVFSSLSNHANEQNRPKTVFNLEDKNKNIRKFSQEDIEIVEKKDDEIQNAVTQNARFKKNDSKRKSSTSSNTPDSPDSNKSLRSRSESLDSLKGEDNSEKSSQDSLDKLDEKEGFEQTVKEKTGSVVDTVVLRKKTAVKQRNDEEPELMKVFARRSLKLKDSEGEAVSAQVTRSESDPKRDSDKENQAESPLEERRKSLVKEPKTARKDESQDNPVITETLTERKYTEKVEMTLRPPSNNHVFPRATSLNPPKVEKEETPVRKQTSFKERRVTDSWIKTNDGIERKISQDEIITSISPKSDFISEEVLTERKNFNQKKAEWEKRAQEAKKKSVP